MEAIIIILAAIIFDQTARPTNKSVDYNEVLEQEHEEHLLFLNYEAS